MQRVRGEGRVAVSHSGGRTRLSELYQQGAAKIRLPRRHDHGVEAVLINTAGGMTGGDRLHWRCDAGEGADLTLTTQACEKVYRAGAGQAEVSVNLRAGAEARLAWLPQETILFDRSALKRTINVDLAADSQGLLLEAVIFGRSAMGETVTQCVLHDRWRVRHEGRLIHAEDFRISGEIQPTLAKAAVTGGATAMATILLTGETAEARAKPARALLNGVGAAASAVAFTELAGTGKLLARLVAEDGYHLRRVLIPLLVLLNGSQPLPKIWAN